MQRLGAGRKKISARGPTRGYRILSRAVSARSAGTTPAADSRVIPTPGSAPSSSPPRHTVSLRAHPTLLLGLRGAASWRGAGGGDGKSSDVSPGRWGGRRRGGAPPVAPRGTACASWASTGRTHRALWTQNTTKKRRHTKDLCTVGQGARARRRGAVISTWTSRTGRCARGACREGWRACRCSGFRHPASTRPRPGWARWRTAAWRSRRNGKPRFLG